MPGKKLATLAREAKRIYNVTHMADFDGMASAAMLVHYLGMPEKNIVFGGPGNPDMKACLKELLSLKIHGSLIVFTDLSINKELTLTLSNALDALARNSNKIVWIDHHPIDPYTLRKLKKKCEIFLCGPSKYCATEQVYNLIKPNPDRYGGTINEIAHFGDFNIYSKKYKSTLRNMAGAIAFINYGDNNEKLRIIVKLISRNRLDDKFITSNARNYKNDSIKNINELKRTSKPADINGYRVGIGYANRLQSSHACSVIQKLFGTDIEIFISVSTSSLHLRSRDGIDSSIIAKDFGGGGHKQASGALVTKGLLDDKQNLMRMIEKRARSVLPERNKLR